MLIALGKTSTVENFVLPANTTVGFNMDEYDTTEELCNGILLIALNSSMISDSSQHALECFHDEEQMRRDSMLTAKVERDNVFWQRACMGLMNDTTTAKQQHHHPGCDGGSISLHQLVNMSSKLCHLKYEDYANVSNELKKMMLVRLVISDEPDGGAEDITSKVMSEYEAELYLRRLYDAIDEQSMVVVKDNIIGTKFSDYISSRQQCAYGCFCFLMIFFSMYNSTKLMKLKNIDWFQGTIKKEVVKTSPYYLTMITPPPPPPVTNIHLQLPIDCSRHWAVEKTPLQNAYLTSSIPETQLVSWAGK